MDISLKCFLILLMFLLILPLANASSDLNVQLTTGNEYAIGETASVYAYMTNNSTGVPYPIDIGTGINNLTIYNPDQSIFVNTAMTEIGNGTFVYGFVVPNVEGVYLIYDNASNLDNWTVGMTSFHVVPWAQKLQEAANSLSTISSDIGRIKNSVESIPLISAGVDALTAWFVRFKVDSLKAFIFGLAIICIILFAILTASFYTVDKMKRRDEEKKVRGYL